MFGSVNFFNFFMKSRMVIC